VGENVSSAAQGAAANLAVDATTAEVLRALESAGARCLLLKGASVTRWLSAREDPRVYGDCDLLVPPADLTTAERVLGALDFKQHFDEGDLPSWWREHSATWMREEDGAKVDLHRSLVGVGVDPERLWLTLSPHVETMVIAGFPARVMTLPGRALHLALHAAQHGAEWDRPLSDLERALSISGAKTWSAAAELADSLEATAAFAAGLRLVPGGREMADRLRLPEDLPVDVALRASTPPPVALGIDQVARARGLRARAAILWHKLVPPPSFMRHWSPTARRGRLGLVLAYLWRPLWLLARLPAGFRAWRHARRLSQRGGSIPS
jgi:hypothetical protein